MSYVSGVVLMFSVVEPYDEHTEGPDTYHVLDRINAWISAEGFSPLRCVEDRAGGSKDPQCVIACAGYNYFDEEAFAQMVMSQAWEVPENVILAIQPEEGPTRIWRPEVPPVAG